MNETASSNLAPGQSTGEPLAGWPKGVRPISYQGMSMIGVDPDGRLYWNGQPLKTESRLSLTNAQTAIALLTAAAAIIGATAALLPAATSTIDFACKRNWLLSICEAKPAGTVSAGQPPSK